MTARFSSGTLFWLIGAGSALFFVLGLQTAGALGVGLLLLLHPEISFVLFLNGGLFKADPRIPSLPVDITILFGGLTIAGILVGLLRDGAGTLGERARESLPLVIFYFLLAGAMLGGLFYTPSPTYGTEKFLRFISLTALACFAPLFLFRTERAVRIFFYGFILLATAMWFDSVFSTPLQKDVWGFHAAFGSNSITQARVAGFSLILVLGLLFSGHQRRMSLLLLGALFFVILHSLLYAGSRGPVLAFLVVSLAGWLYWLLASEAKGRVAGVGALAIAAMAGFGFQFRSHFYTLLTRLEGVGEEPLSATGVRGDFWRMSIDSLAGSPGAPFIGVGTGGFNHIAGYRDTLMGEYPHNLLAEVFCENGILGLSALLGLLWIASRKIGSLLRRPPGAYPLAYSVCGLVGFTFINACFSGDINNNREFFTSLGMLYAVDHLYRRSSS